MTRPAIHVRRATAEDAEAAARVHAASSEAAYRGLVPAGSLMHLERRVEMWRILVEDQAAHSFVAEAGGQIVGVMNVGPADDGEPVGKLRILYVLPEWWGSRAGQVLLERAHTLLAADHDEAILTVLAANPRARRFYERNGWQFERLVVESHFGGQPIEVARYRRRLRPSTRARRVRAYVGLGSNVGDPWRTLEAAVAALASLPRVRLAGVSRLYRTRPVGVVDQPDFLNAVVALEVPLGDDPEAGAIELLVALKGLEQTFGRRARGRWGPRELDLDLLVFGRHAISVERPPEATPRSVDLDPGAAARLLEVPHPSMRERLFVLAPLGDLAPGLVPPGWPETVETARRRRAGIEADDAVSVVGDWTGERWRR